MFNSFIFPLGVLLIITECEAARKSNSYSNINTVDSLRNNHKYGSLIQGNESLQDAEYNFCIKGLLEHKNKEEIFGPFYKFAIEFTPVSLPCSPCRYSNRPTVTWMKLSFENVKTAIQPSADFVVRMDDSLVINKPDPSDFATYYCLVEGFVGYIWSLEVEPFQYFDILKARHWQSKPTTLSYMKISTKWEPWSLCNKCNEVGKRHRLGYCYVEPIANGEKKLKALQVYKQGLSCNLFILIHPETDPETIEILERRKAVLLIGYCRTPCDYFDISPEEAYARVHPKIHLVYQDQMEMRADAELQKLREENKGKRGLLPGKPTAFEGFIIFCLVGLQVYIVVHICKYRRKAN